jgi:predicted Fe-Mo cluster-binding NifX family protein
MKIAVSAVKGKLDEPFNPRFGRADQFVIYDTESQAHEAAANPAASARGGAGAQAVQFLAGKGVQAVISGRYGPNAYTALEAAGIGAYVAQTGTVAEVIEQYQAGSLEQVSGATGPELHGGH